MVTSSLSAHQQIPQPFNTPKPLSIDQAIADMFVSNVNVEMLEGWEKFRFKVKDLVTWWFLAACFCFGVSVYANITEDNEGSVFDEK